jgi:hypothetical protein
MALSTGKRGARPENIDLILQRGRYFGRLSVLNRLRSSFHPRKQVGSSVGCFRRVSSVLAVAYFDKKSL